MFRSTLFGFVTFVDHLCAYLHSLASATGGLYCRLRLPPPLSPPPTDGLHLQTSNIFTTSMRERLPKSNPLRSFLVPFTYGTISINDAARVTLVTPNSWLPRAFPFDDAGLQLGWANAYRFLPYQVAAPGTKDFLFKLFDRGAGCRAKMEAGVQTEYWRQVTPAPAPREGPLFVSGLEDESLTRRDASRTGMDASQDVLPALGAVFA